MQLFSRFVTGGEAPMGSVGLYLFRREETVFLDVCPASLR